MNGCGIVSKVSGAILTSLIVRWTHNLIEKLTVAGWYLSHGFPMPTSLNRLRKVLFAMLKEGGGGEGFDHKDFILRLSSHLALYFLFEVTSEHNTPLHSSIHVSSSQTSSLRNTP